MQVRGCENMIKGWANICNSRQKKYEVKFQRLILEKAKRWTTTLLFIIFLLAENTVFDEKHLFWVAL